MSLSDKVRVIGFCGVDDTVSYELLELVSSRYPWAEWGVLFRTDLEGTGRYATMDWVRKLSQARSSCSHEMKLAAHLCGNRCAQVLSGDASFASEIHSLGFNRIQINPTAANDVNIDPTQYSTYGANLLQVFAAVPTVEFLFQLNTETRPIWEALLTLGVPSNVSILHDASCGKGVRIDTFPSPQQFGTIPCGYAGGIGPATIGAVLDTIVQDVELPTTHRKVWIDMESSLRSKLQVGDQSVDIFDINKVMECIAIAVERGMRE